MVLVETEVRVYHGADTAVLTMRFPTGLNHTDVAGSDGSDLLSCFPCLHVPQTSDKGMLAFNGGMAGSQVSADLLAMAC